MGQLLASSPGSHLPLGQELEVPEEDELLLELVLEPLLELAPLLLELVPLLLELVPLLLELAPLLLEPPPASEPPCGT